jgi:hypothetical protein
LCHSKQNIQYSMHISNDTTIAFFPNLTCLVTRWIFWVPVEYSRSALGNTDSSSPQPWQISRDLPPKPNWLAATVHCTVHTYGYHVTLRSKSALQVILLAHYVFLSILHFSLILLALTRHSINSTCLSISQSTTYLEAFVKALQYDLYLGFSAAGKSKMQ